MMNSLRVLLLPLLFLLRAAIVGSQEREHLLEAKKYPLVEQYKESSSPYARVGGVAVFLLASLSNAIELGEEVPTHEFTDYFARLTAAKSTRAAHVEHFYGVTGEGEKLHDVFVSSSNV